MSLYSVKDEKLQRLKILLINPMVSIQLNKTKEISCPVKVNRVPDYGSSQCYLTLQPIHEQGMIIIKNNLQDTTVNG